MRSRDKVILAKVGLDGHDVGVRLVGRTLMDAGYEVIYLGKRVTTAEIVAVTIAEDADAVGLSGLSGGLGHFATQVRQALDEQDVDVPVVAGGIDEHDEISAMLASGVAQFLGPSSTSSDIVAAFKAVTAGVGRPDVIVARSRHNPEDSEGGSR